MDTIFARAEVVAERVDVFNHLGLGCKRRGKGCRVGRLALAFAGGRRGHGARCIDCNSLHMTAVVAADSCRGHRAVVFGPFIGRLAPIMAGSRDGRRSNNLVIQRSAVIHLAADVALPVGLIAVFGAGRVLFILVNTILRVAGSRKRLILLLLGEQRIREGRRVDRKALFCASRLDRDAFNSVHRLGFFVVRIVQTGHCCGAGAQVFATDVDRRAPVVVRLADILSLYVCVGVSVEDRRCGINVCGALFTTRRAWRLGDSADHRFFMAFVILADKGRSGGGITRPCEGRFAPIVAAGRNHNRALVGDLVSVAGRMLVAAEEFAAACANPVCSVAVFGAGFFNSGNRREVVSEGGAFSFRLVAADCAVLRLGTHGQAAFVFADHPAVFAEFAGSRTSDTVFIGAVLFAAVDALEGMGAVSVVLHAAGKAVAGGRDRFRRAGFCPVVAVIAGVCSVYVFTRCVAVRRSCRLCYDAVNLFCMTTVVLANEGRLCSVTVPHERRTCAVIVSDRFGHHIGRVDRVICGGRYGCSRIKEQAAVVALLIGFVARFFTGGLNGGNRREAVAGGRKHGGGQLCGLIRSEQLVAGRAQPVFHVAFRQAGRRLRGHMGGKRMVGVDLQLCQRLFGQHVVFINEQMAAGVANPVFRRAVVGAGCRSLGHMRQNRVIVRSYRNRQRGKIGDLRLGSTVGEDFAAARAGPVFDVARFHAGGCLGRRLYQHMAKRGDVVHSLGLGRKRLGKDRRIGRGAGRGAVGVGRLGCRIGDPDHHVAFVVAALHRCGDLAVVIAPDVRDRFRVPVVTGGLIDHAGLIGDLLRT